MGKGAQTPSLKVRRGLKFPTPPDSAPMEMFIIIRDKETEREIYKNNPNK